MPDTPLDEDAKLTLAEIWATLDGHLDAFIAERDNIIKPDDPRHTSHFDGYCIEASEMLSELAKRGYRLVRI